MMNNHVQRTLNLDRGSLRRPDFFMNLQRVTAKQSVFVCLSDLDSGLDAGVLRLVPANCC